MITLIHGDNIEASRAELSRRKSRAGSAELRVLDGRSIEETALIQALESSSLFGGERVVVIEQMLGGREKKSRSLETLTVHLRKAEGVEVILWEDKEISAAVIGSLGKAVDVRVFKIPVVIFQLLDALGPRKAKSLLVLFQQAVALDAPELVSAMLVKRVRQLIMIRDAVVPAGLAAWQAERLTKQAKFFTMEQLLAMHGRLLDMEYQLKTGATPFHLTQLLEQFLISL